MNFSILSVANYVIAYSYIYDNIYQGSIDILDFQDIRVAFLSEDILL